MNTTQKIYHFSIIAIACLIPSGFYQLTLAALAVTAICWFVQGNYKQLRNIKQQPHVILFFLFYFYIAAGFFFSDDRGEALSSLSVYLPLILFPLFITCSDMVTEKLMRQAESAFIYSTCLFMLIALLYATYDVSQTHTTELIQGGAVYNKFTYYGLTRVFDNWHPTYMALFCNHAVFLAIRRAIAKCQEKNKSTAFGYTALIVFLSVCIFLLNSITGIVALMIIFLHFIIVLLRKIKLSGYFKIILGVFCIGIAVAFLYINPFGIQKLERVKDQKIAITDDYHERNMLTIRLAKWETHLVIISRHPLFGTTVGDIRNTRKRTYEEMKFNDLALHNYNAHNEFVETAATYGIVGFVLFIAMIITAARRATNRNFGLFLVIVLVTFLTESILERQQGMNYVMFFFAFYTTVVANKNQYNPVTEQRKLATT